MNLAAFIPLSAAAVNLALVIFVLSSGAKSVLHRVYAVWGLSIVVWNVGTYFMFTADSPEEALFWARFLHFGVIFLPFSLMHLCLLIAQAPKPRLTKFLYIIPCLFAAVNCTDYFVPAVRNVGYAYYSVGGPVYFCFVGLYAALTWSTMFILWRRGKHAPPFLRARIVSLLWASGILIAFGNNDLLPILGIYYYPFTHVRIFPFGSFAAILYGLLTGYSTLQHQLLDVQVVISRFVAHTIRLLFMFLIGLVVLLGIWGVLPQEFTPISFFSALVVLLISGLVASFLFPRLFGSGSEVWERRFLGDRFEYHDQIRGFVSSMQQYSDSGALLDEFNELLVKTVRVRKYQIVLTDESHRTYTTLRSYPEEPVRKLAETTAEFPVFRFFERTKSEYIGSKLLQALPGAMELEASAREFLRQVEAEFCLPLVRDLQVFGVLMLGSKVDNSPYTATDISLMVSLVRHLSLVLNQLRLKEQVLQAQEVELVGRMSRGMAHDLNNLVTPVQTLLQLISEGISTEDLRDDLLPVALRSVDTMREYVREALFFSENSRPDFRLGRLDVLLLESADIIAPRCAKKDLRVVVNASEEVLVEMDKSLIKRLLTNILANAADASSEGASILVDLSRLSKNDKDREWVRIRVVDSGEGIKPEDMDRIFAPYFTTKNRGDQQRGFGLGLSICRKVVQLHGGSLKVLSQPGKGTTIEIELPDHQVKTPVPAIAPPAATTAPATAGASSS